MLMLRAVLVAVCLSVSVSPWPAYAALAPDSYLPTVAELPPGVELRQADGARQVGLSGGVEETRLYSSTLPPAAIAVSVSVLDAQWAPQRYASGLSAYLTRGFIVSRSNTRTVGNDVELVQAGPELTRQLRVMLAGSVTSSVTLLYNNAQATNAEVSALAESIAAPLMLKMLAHPDGI